MQLSRIDDLSRIFSEVVDAPADQQDALLHRLCPEDELRTQVRAMLDADASDDPLLDHALVPTPVDVLVGETIDGYELIQELARGGMGVVFMAEQTEPVRRTVAMKVIKPGVDTREVIARFDAERHALSLMDHPNIAKVLDAGTTDAGRPYFVMELVHGQPITEYCHRNRLSIHDRLELFLSVCRAIQHAHQKGIIHRDIKPSNVLVAEYDGSPVAKVIDFGIAKAINQSLTDLTMQTGLGQIIGTFEYMSPEQSRVNQVDVDTRTDIYSLGVLLYELLTGVPPFEKERLRGVEWEEMLRIIREEDPPKPSARVADITNTDASVQRERDPSSKRGGLLRDELDWIVMKAMEKDRSRRYETPSALAGDIECFLRGDAVAACPPSAIYLFRKFARRNKVVLATSAIVAASLVVGLLGTTWQAVRAGRAEKVASARRDEAEAIMAFMRDHLLSLAGAESQVAFEIDADPSVRSATLDRVRDQVDQRFADQPDMEARLKETLASSFNSIGRYDVVASLYTDVMNNFESDESRTHVEKIRVMRQLAVAYIHQSELIDAECLCDRALRYSRKELGDDHELTLALRSDIAVLQQRQGRYADAETALDQCLVQRRRLLGDDHPDTLDTQSNLADLFFLQNRLDASDQLHRYVLDQQQQILPANDTRIAKTLVNLGRCSLQRGQRDGDPIHWDNAASQLETGLAIYEATRPLDHPETLDAQWTLAQVVCQQRRYDDAARLLTDLVDRLQRQRGTDHVATLDAMNALGWAWMHQGRLVAAENVLVETVTVRRRMELTDASAIQAMGNLAIVYHRMGKLDQSIELDKETLALASGHLPPYHPETIACRVRLGWSQLDLGLISDGQSQLQAAYGAAQDAGMACQIAGSLANSYRQAGDRASVLVWTDRQTQIGRDLLADDPLQLANILADGGARFLKVDAFDRAEALLRECLAILRDDPAKSWRTFHVQSMLGDSLGRQQKFDEAETLLTDACEELLRRSEEDVAGQRDQDEQAQLNSDLNNALNSTIERLVSLYESTGNAQASARWREKYATLAVDGHADL